MATSRTRKSKDAERDVPTQDLVPMGHDDTGKLEGEGRKFRARNEFGEPDKVDVHVGRRVRLRRTLMGLSQTDLAKSVSLTFQQVQKYESGANRISASRLFYIAQSLDVPIGFFFDDMSSTPGLAEEPAPGFNYEPDRELLELTRNYRSISDPDVRRSIYELVKRLASRDEE